MITLFVKAATTKLKILHSVLLINCRNLAH